MIYEEAQKIFASENLPLTESHFQMLETYRKALIETNEHMNLTAITEETAVWYKHFLDSALVLKSISIPLYASLIDVGTGAGFPGLVLSILRPDLQITLLDSLQKRVNFLESVCETLGLNHVTCIHERAEIGGKNPELREKFDYSIARAVAELPVLCEYCLPFVKIGGSFIAMKGPGEQAEDAAKALEELKGKLVDSILYESEQLGVRQIFQFEKIGETPEKYPRKSKQIQTKPLIAG